MVVIRYVVDDELGASSHGAIWPKQLPLMNGVCEQLSKSLPLMVPKKNSPHVVLHDIVSHNMIEIQHGNK